MISEDAQFSIEKLANAINNAFVSPNVSDSNLEPANIVDVIDKMANNMARIADAVSILAAEQRKGQ
jgi:hypothetical protein